MKHTAATPGVHLRRYLALALALAMTLALAPLAAAPAYADADTPDLIIVDDVQPPAAGTADVVVVHGVPNLDVDIWIDGEVELEGVSYLDTAILDGLAPGSYDVAIAPAGTEDVVLDDQFELEADTSYSVAAYLDEDGSPQLGAFVNTEASPAIHFFHLAAYPAVTVLALGALEIFGDVANGESDVAEVETFPAGTEVNADVRAEGREDFSIDIVVPAGLMLAYAVGPVSAFDAPEPTDPEEPTDPTDPEEPAEPETPTEPEEPTEPETPAAPVFTDVDPESVHAPAIAALVEVGVTTGVTPDTFAPARSVTRAQMATFLARALDLDVDEDAVPDFTDVDADDVHAPSIAALVEAEITLGRPDGTFGPGEPVRRDQMASFLTRGFELPVPADVDLPFVDVSEDSLHLESIAALVESRITTGTSATEFSPQADVRRDQMATFLARAMGLVPLPG